MFGFCFNLMGLVDGGVVAGKWWDKVLFKFEGWGEEEFKVAGFCVVLFCVVCWGFFIVLGVVLMLFYVNFGVYVDEGMMVDIWVMVGFCV